MKNKDSLLSFLLVCMTALALFVILIVYNSTNIVQASLPSVSPPSTEEGYADVPIKQVISTTLSEQISKKWIRFKAKYSMTVPEVADLPKEYQDGWIRFSIMDPNDILASDVNLIIPKEKSNILAELKYGDVIEVFAYSEPIKTTVFERTVKRVLFIVEKIRRVKQ